MEKKISPEAAAFLESGEAAYDNGDWDKAIADLTEAIRLDPNDAIAYYNRGILYYKKNDCDSAIADYTEAIRLDPNDVCAYNNRGNVYNENGDWDKAIADYTEAIRLDPNNAKAYNNRSIAYKKKDELDKAIADYTEAIRLDPNEADMQEQLFLTPKDQLGYAEEYIIVNSKNKKESDLLNYSLSNSIEDIKIAIFARAGQNIDLDKAYWRLNTNLSVSVKHLMNKHQVNYSMTITGNENNRGIVVNMRSGEKWFVTGYSEINGTFFSWRDMSVFRIVAKFIENIKEDD
jgi:tetratricopeptide (TPR) repeat protein